MTANTWFKVKGSKVKVTAYVTANTDLIKATPTIVGAVSYTHLTLPTKRIV